MSLSVLKQIHTFLLENKSTSSECFSTQRSEGRSQIDKSKKAQNLFKDLATGLKRIEYLPQTQIF